MTRLRWGIIGTGYAATLFASDLARAEASRPHAVAGRDPARTARFAAEFGVPVAHRTPEELLADPDVDAVHVAVPHTEHGRWVLRAIEAGKAVLCEKPLAVDPDEARALVAAATRSGTFLMEGFMYRLHPQTRLVADLVAKGVLGDVRLIRASFTIDAARDPGHRLFDPALGGGAIHDLGCYPMSMARLIAGAVEGRSHAEPDLLAAAGHIGPTGVDESASALLRFPTGVVAQLSAGLTAPAERGLRVEGTAGALVVTDPWSGGRPADVLTADQTADSGAVRLLTAGGSEVIPAVADLPLFAGEADHVAECLATGRTQSPVVSLDDTLGNVAALHRWRAAIG
ncbi:Gfo/Idh/MocA family oxidoreductase [Actinosynnema sp. NPDC023794]